MASFTTPTVHVNQLGWGPTSLPEQYLLLPFAPFGKGDRLGRAADFSAKDARYRSRYRDEPVTPAEEVYKMVEDPKTKAKANKSMRGRHFRGRWGRGGFHNRAQNRNEEPAPLLKGKQAKYLVQSHGRKGYNNKRRGTFRRYNNRNLPTLESSVKVEPSWKVVQQFDLSALTKLRLTPPSGKDLKTCGHLCKYNEGYERITAKNTQKLKRFANIQFNSTTTMDDPVIQAYATEYAQKSAGNVVFATDELIAQLMTCPRSVLPWDLYFTRLENGLMFIDKREDSGLEMLSVNETLSHRQQQDNEKLTVQPFDRADKLSIEATAINQNFSQQVVDKTAKQKTFDHPNPFWDEEDEEEGSEPAAFAYKYRKFKLSENTTLIARTELHAYTRKTNPQTGKKGIQYMTVYALNEANPKLSGSPSWRQKIDSSRGSVIATELKNNACKMGKWTAQTILAGADLMKVGFVSRQAVKDPFNHVVLGTQFYRPDEFASQTNLIQTNMWGIVKSIIDMIYAQPPGKYVLLKEPNRPSLEIYSVPMNTFNDSIDDDEDSGFEDEDN
mmetsp:Transcript_20290/g.33475  ORF Transcript_20290/g.33475 Transcript_20290/m.33475 type:complete len:555 (+) Transcript_20290:121-1785(+)|eukprot:CAMPEP_0203761826 /NCGR_PEP_ID=MMETSP0098-20131031/14833_1 /ASSEMBLY_ACC=CAM_ASM_000208 /TAXON_ID=96639 /ORGANISM=" , Strain NY0313808BC1" /LENGTH=554 /DNA_ID=CAMNT_0050655981 /DNA_START=141 /DNA_END=1805 /DNA_ORIENTATION=-